VIHARCGGGIKARAAAEASVVDCMAARAAARAAIAGAKEGRLVGGGRGC
jgi:hypothetical protein